MNSIQRKADVTLALDDAQLRGEPHAPSVPRQTPRWICNETADETIQWYPVGSINHVHSSQKRHTGHHRTSITWAWSVVLCYYTFHSSAPDALLQ